MNQTDTELIDAIRSGNESLFEELVKRYSSPAYTFAYRLTGDKDLSEDITQQAFIKIWKHLGRFDTRKQFKTWMFAIVRNTAIDHFRSKKTFSFSELFRKNDTFDEFEDTLVDEEALADEIFEQTESITSVRKALETLHVEEKSIIFLHLDEELSFKEIAETLKKSIHTIKSTYRRALLKVKKHLSAPK